ncbi:hypothetical protein HNR65_003527 [Desulfosalsimonas propionicica]|uniref:Uncharacterized protein n=1 Tax=Desulfosalsimonas propionicica TaxID=332175 RepID=A0A7W0CCE3_9BACT|nr:hypothetical protein [Desulfosalsimonas propionicica]MBA2883166.1 hypothetical protein [Desulfosalsimonas propionicica]
MAINLFHRKQGSFPIISLIILMVIFVLTFNVIPEGFAAKLDYKKYKKRLEEVTGRNCTRAEIFNIVGRDAFDPATIPKQPSDKPADDRLEAKTLCSHEHGFSIDIPNDWAKRKPKQPQTLFSFAKMGAGQNLNINVLDAKGKASIKQIPLQQLFYPFYESIQIIEKKYINKDGMFLLTCIYELRNGNLKKRLEGAHNLKYLTASWIKDQKLFTITFTDSKAEFGNNLPAFKNILGSICFEK